MVQFPNYPDQPGKIPHAKHKQTVFNFVGYVFRQCDPFLEKIMPELGEHHERDELHGPLNGFEDLVQPHTVQFPHSS